MISRLVAFFATGDSIVSNNLVLNLYQHINAPEARLYLSQQLAEEALHVQFYLTLFYTYLPDHKERNEAFAAIENDSEHQSARPRSATSGWIRLHDLKQLETKEHRKMFLLNLICFATCIEGLFFFAAFAYVYFFAQPGFAARFGHRHQLGVSRHISHMAFAFAVIDVVRTESPHLFDDDLAERIREMIDEAIDCEHEFAMDLLGEGVPGMSTADTRTYLEFVADQRLGQLGLAQRYGAKNPFDFMELQDVQELTNFFERTVAAYQVGVEGDVSFDAWDLARATGQDLAVDDELATWALQTWQAVVPAEGREGDAFHAVVAVADDASALDRLVGYTGRQP